MALIFWKSRPNNEDGSGEPEKSLPLLPKGSVMGSRVGIAVGSFGSVTGPCEVSFLGSVDYFVGFGVDGPAAVVDAGVSPFLIKAGVVSTYRLSAGTVFFSPSAA